jgi:hypothetical protein
MRLEADMDSKPVSYIGARGVFRLAGQSILGWKILRAWEAQESYMEMMEGVWTVRDLGKRNTAREELSALEEQMWFAVQYSLIIEV